ncbi:hypothetical protein QUF75_00250 [Desulfococcaceae bacterium HSG7]|nr:hypothetical protein [Desulfococcaceae bacterium HSG7]
MRHPLVESNHLTKTASAIFVQKDPKTNLTNNSDKTDSNIRHIKNAIRNAQDISAASAELDSQWVYWPTEYHLNAMRANLLRGLNFENIRTALDVSAGCGVITRCLGESGIQTDALETEHANAEIIKLRCRDLNNINVFNLSLDEIRLPERTYDAIFLIDALDNICLMQSDSNEHREAVIEILKRLQAGLTENGLLCIAVSNRMGLKYQMGASDGCYNRPYIGLNGYPSNPPNRDYDRREWKTLLNKAEFPCYTFAYPFPDHLLTRVILSDHFVKSDRYAHSSLYHVKSRDYFNTDWRPDDDEFLRWETLGHSGYLADFANSFLIMAAGDQAILNQVLPYDFIHFSNPLRQKKYGTVTYKLRDADRVCKKKTAPDSDQTDKTLVCHTPEADNYIRGPLLASAWLHALLDNHADSAFKKLLKEYYSFLVDYFKDNQLRTCALDLLPFNIIVDAQGVYKTFDLEWRSDEIFEPEFIFFRALMWFGYTHEIFITRFCEQRNLYTISDFIIHGFNLLSHPFEDKMERFVTLEERIHQKIDSGNVSDKGPEPVKQLIEQPFQFVTQTLQSKTFAAQLYWVVKDNALESESSLTVSAPLGGDPQVLFFRLPPNISDIGILRFDPADRTGFFHLSTVQLQWCDNQGGREQILWEIKGARNIATKAIMQDVHFCPSALGDTFLSTSEDPQMIFEFPDEIKPPEPMGVFLFKARMDWPKSADYLAAADIVKKMALKIKAQKTLIAEKEKRMVEYHAQLTEKNAQLSQSSQLGFQLGFKDEQMRVQEARITELNAQVNERDAKINILEFKLNLIRKSGLGKIFKAFKRALN